MKPVAVCFRVVLYSPKNCTAPGYADRLVSLTLPLTGPGGWRALISAKCVYQILLWFSRTPKLVVPSNPSPCLCHRCIDTLGAITAPPYTPPQQLNRGLCTLLVMEDLDIIPPEEVKSVSVQLVTYNGHQKSAFGSISVDFSFEDGTCVAEPGVRCFFSGVTCFWDRLGVCYGTVVCRMYLLM